MIRYENGKYIISVTNDCEIKISPYIVRKLLDYYKEESIRQDIQMKVDGEYSPEIADKILSDEKLMQAIIQNYTKAVENDDSWSYMMDSAISTAISDMGYPYEERTDNDE